MSVLCRDHLLPIIVTTLPGGTISFCPTCGPGFPPLLLNTIGGP